MRVAIVTAFFPSASSPYTGAPLYAQIPFLQQLADIQVFCPRLHYPPLRFLQPRRHLYRHASNGYDLPGVDAQHFPYRTIPIIGRAFNGYLGGRAAFDTVKKFAPDIIVGYAVYPDGFAALKIGQRLGVPVILFAIGSDVRYVPDPVQRALVRSALSGADYTLSVSHELLERAIDLGANRQRSKTILNGCDTSIFRRLDRTEMRQKLGIRPDAREIIFVGRLVPLKGLRETFEALAIARQSWPDIEFTCIGEGPLEEELRARAERADLKGAVRFIPIAKPPQIADWMGAADLTVLASYTEGCPNVVIESLACGKPVVAADVGGIPELVNGSNGVLVKPHDAADLARGIDAALRRRWDEASISAAAQRSWADVARETIDVCQEVLNSRHVRTESK